jgi:hypothetical protein
MTFKWRFKRKKRAKLERETEEAICKAESVEQEVVKPLEQKRDAFTYNHLAFLAAEGLGIVREDRRKLFV